MRFGIAFDGAILLWSATGGTALAQAQVTCPDPSKLGVARTVQIDTTGGPGFGMDHYKAYDFLRLKEVVLTFDDGPQVRTTHAILEALAEQCTKATFFSVGKMAAGLPEIIRDVAKAGHTVGIHTWSHADLRRLKTEQAWKDEIEKSVSAVTMAVGSPIAPFFRYPYLRDSKETLAYLASRNVAVFSADLDSQDFKLTNADRVVKSVMRRLEKKTKGIILMHDIRPATAKAIPALLAELKAHGYKVVHLTPKAKLKTLAEYDQQIEKDMKGLAAGHSRPMSSVVTTVEEVGVGQASAAPMKK